MVTHRGTRWRNRRGMTRIGCLFGLLLFVTGVYYGVNIGSVYMRYWRLVDEMRGQAKVAPGIDDDAIRRRLLHKIEDLGLPEEARKLSINRTYRPREIRINTTYRDTLVLPFFKYIITFNPEAKQPL
ncbi:MAG: hypothetical protein GTN62_08850 [Gemmatimonadales bacterium]|nr:hypothetical protein [Gemmatimonadales bacterium]NIN50204.1 hypothetical protein [Gemmatimonadales bacterium]NIP07668.1 hypothetical protein [Gemmatimonadales bacterium]NIR01820.1 hypothetical protein [Gemmatimonadales bacterium]NIS65723.1 hypothetical protein [Gemmatimonadales bacterium]